MKRCPNCNHENKSSASYCERCGSPLATPAPYTLYHPPQQNQEVYGSPFSPSSESYPSPSSAESNPPIPSEYALPQPPVYTTASGNIILSIVLYLWGVIVAWFGFAGGVLNSTPNYVVNLTFFLGVLVSIIILILVLRKHKRPHYRSKQ